MTITHGLFAGLEDIKAVRLTCKNCGLVTSIPVVSIQNWPLTCGNCAESWFLRGSIERESLVKLMDALTTLSKRGQDAATLIQFELPSPQ